MRHLEDDILSSYVSGDLSEPDATECQGHLVECNTCRQDLALLIRVMDENVSPEELAIIDRIEISRSGAGLRVTQPLHGYDFVTQWLKPGWKPMLVFASMAVIVAAALLFNSRFSTPAPVSSSERTFEARLSRQPYSGFTRTRTGAATAEPASANDELNRLGANHAELGRFYLQHTEFVKAVAELENAGKQNPDSVEICNDLGVAYMESADDRLLEKALGQFQRALQLNPKYGPALFNLALVHERLGHFADAEQELKSYLQIDPDSGWAQEVKARLPLSKH